MFAEIYVEALLVDEELADLVWRLWRQNEILKLGAAFLWLAAVESATDQNQRLCLLRLVRKF